MTLTSSSQTYGAITKTFHWLTVLLLLTVIPLGIIANDMAFDTGDALARKAWLFSLHKTVGVTVFFVALARIAWALGQPKPGLLHADRKLESWLAETVHWVLYGTLVLVPLSGWIHHAATTGYAPIWWPFGQSLPFVPKNDDVASVFAGLHVIFGRLLVVSIGLHVAGALKHHFIDRDVTLRRMLPGQPEVPPLAPHKTALAPILSAFGAYLLAIGVGLSLGMFNDDTPAAQVARLDAVDTGWTVTQGTLDLTVTQFGSAVTGTFADWTAAIDFDENSTTPTPGTVKVTIAIGSLTLGSVTGQAMGADFFDAATFPTAIFEGPISRAQDGYVVEGVLDLKGMQLPLTLPFALDINGDTATMSGTTTIERLRHNIGQSYPEGASLGLSVDVSARLTATRTTN
ncbi:MAG: cytochrome b561/polyisoprenoid-binding protein YceI [Paracoccaceae bacterium]|jgi:cytochrome b561/polyisoprenoid-binding protein YceI